MLGYHCVVPCVCFFGYSLGLSTFSPINHTFLFPRRSFCFNPPIQARVFFLCLPASQCTCTCAGNAWHNKSNRPPTLTHGEIRHGRTLFIWLICGNDSAAQHHRSIYSGNLSLTLCVRLFFFLCVHLTVKVGGDKTHLQPGQILLSSRRVSFSRGLVGEVTWKKSRPSNLAARNNTHAYLWDTHSQWVTKTDTGSHMHADVGRRLYLYQRSNKSLCSLVYFLWLCPCSTECLHNFKTGGGERREELKSGEIGEDKCPMAFSSSVAHLSVS